MTLLCMQKMFLVFFLSDALCQACILLGEESPAYFLSKLFSHGLINNLSNDNKAEYASVRVTRSSRPNTRWLPVRHAHFLVCDQVVKDSKEKLPRSSLSADVQAEQVTNGNKRSTWLAANLVTFEGRLSRKKISKAHVDRRPFWILSIY